MGESISATEGAATLKLKLQIELTFSSSHYMPVSSKPSPSTDLMKSGVWQGSPFFLLFF